MPETIYLDTATRDVEKVVRPLAVRSDVYVPIQTLFPGATFIRTLKSACSQASRGRGGDEEHPWRLQLKGKLKAVLCQGGWGCKRVGRWEGRWGGHLL